MWWYLSSLSSTQILNSQKENWESKLSHGGNTMLTQDLRGALQFYGLPGDAWTRDKSTMKIKNNFEIITFDDKLLAFQICFHAQNGFGFP